MFFRTITGTVESLGEVASEQETAGGRLVTISFIRIREPDSTITLIQYVATGQRLARYAVAGFEGTFHLCGKKARDNILFALTTGTKTFDDIDALAEAFGGLRNAVLANCYKSFILGAVTAIILIGFIFIWLGVLQLRTVLGIPSPGSIRSECSKALANDRRPAPT